MQRRNLVGRIGGILSPLLVYFVITMLVQMIAIVLSYPINEFATEITAFGALCEIPVFVWMLRRDKREREQMQSIESSLTLWGVLLVAGVCLAILLNGLIMFSGLMEFSNRYQETAELLYMPAFSVQLLCIGVIVPIAEEFLFRGLIYQRLRDWGGRWLAFFLSALLFGVFHGNLVQGIYGFCAGLFLAFVCERMRHVAAPILVHMVMNLTSCVLTEYEGFTWVFTSGERFVGSMLLMAALLLIGLFVLRYRGTDVVK